MAICRGKCGGGLVAWQVIWPSAYCCHSFFECFRQVGFAFAVFEKYIYLNCFCNCKEYVEPWPVF